MPAYAVAPEAVEHARELIASHRYVLGSEWNEAQPDAEAENAYLERHDWGSYGLWHLGRTEGANPETKRLYAFAYGDFQRLHRMGLIACRYRAAEWGHKEIELAAHELLQELDAARSD